jgi:Na+/H+-translocating membrane pyrophosphatase
MSQYPQYPQYPYYPAGGQYQVDPSGYSSQATGAYPQAQVSWTQGWFAVTDPGYLKGALLGAAVTYLLTNPKVQRAMVKGVVTLWTTVQGGVEEVKEQIQDIKAEMSMKTDADKK